MKEDYLLTELKKNLSSQKSYDNYVARLSKVSSLIGKPLAYMLTHPTEVYPKIKEEYGNISTRKNVLTAILSVFRANPKFMDENAEAQKQWKKYFMDMALLQEVSAKKNKLSEKQKKNYTGTEDVELKWLELGKEDPHVTLKSSQEYLLLTLLKEVTPKRSDFGQVRIYRNVDPNKYDENYIVLHDASSNVSSYLVINKYKTEKKGGRWEEELTAQADKVIKESLRRHPRNYLFVGRDKKAYGSNDAYGKFVVRTFESLFGKKTGTSLWRHIFITEKVPANASEEFREQIAKSMLHSVRQQSRYRIDTKESKEKVCYCVRKGDLA